ncbi:hypothetical protein [Dyella sp. 2HG41-7]|uniref:HNH endonuclease n=1 Tax=Dyella sp. 2HG41-7 TaxID=2883239 RepID=UPI001F254132|nr:hypothetical protein [Dyella sp. 2HG41-7]
MAHPLFSITREQAQDIIDHLRSLPSIRELAANPPPRPWTPEWTVPVNPEALAAFTGKIARMKPWSHGGQAWSHRKLFKEWGGKCAYCGVKLLHPDEATPTERRLRPCADHLLPHASGGMLNGATVLACYSCNTLKGSLDWLEWGKARSPNVRKRLLALRMAEHRRAFNHFSRDPVKVRTDRMIGRMLEARWQHPRFKVYASMTTAGTFIGWKLGWHVPQAALFILKGLKGEPLNDGSGVIGFTFDKPTAALEAIWSLIDINAWVLSLELDGFPHLAPQGASDWRMWSPNFRDLVKRELAKDRPKRNKPKWKPYRRRNRE